MMKPIDLYVVPPSPPCRAVIIAAKYMKINVKLIQVNLMKGEQKEDWFVKMNPQHCLPTIDDNGFILWESRAIMSYFANKYAPDDPIYPHDPKKRGIVDRLMQYDLNILYRSLGDFLIPIVREGKTTKFLNTINERKVIEALSYLDSILTSNDYVAGDHLTLADFSYYCSLEFADSFNYDLSKYSNVYCYYNRLKPALRGMNNHQTISIKNEIQDDLSSMFLSNGSLNSFSSTKDCHLNCWNHSNPINNNSTDHAQDDQSQPKDDFDPNSLIMLQNNDSSSDHYNIYQRRPEDLYRMLNLNLPHQSSDNSPSSSIDNHKNENHVNPTENDNIDSKLQNATPLPNLNTPTPTKNKNDVNCNGKDVCCQDCCPNPNHPNNRDKYLFC